MGRILRGSEDCFSIDTKAMKPEFDYPILWHGENYKIRFESGVLIWGKLAKDEKLDWPENE